MRILLVILALAAVTQPARADDFATWAALREGVVVALIRHARAPGSGDPPGFRLGDCATQRNLDASGRTQAVALGSRFRAEGVPLGDILSSRWCRALETAGLAFAGLAVTPNPALDSFFDERGSGPAQTAAVRELLSTRSGDRTTLVLVTHQVNISALAGVSPAEGEVVVVRATPGAGISVVGRVRP